MKVKELLDSWECFCRQRNIFSPNDKNLLEFLVDYGFDEQLSKDIVDCLDDDLYGEPIQSDNEEGTGSKYQFIDTIVKIEEKKLSHKEIGRAFNVLSKNKQSDLKNINLDDFMKKWATAVRKAPRPDKNKLMRAVIHGILKCPNRSNNLLLIREVEKALKRSQRNPAFNRKVFTFKNGQILNNDFYLLASRFIHECGGSWLDFNVRPFKINERYVKMQMIMNFGGRDVLVEDIMTKLSQRVPEMYEMYKLTHTVGRRNK